MLLHGQAPEALDVADVARESGREMVRPSSLPSFVVSHRLLGGHASAKPGTPAAQPRVGVNVEADRRYLRLSDIAVEVLDFTGDERLELRYQGSQHLLVVHYQGARRAGDARVGEMRSSTRDIRRKMTFVPAGQIYHE